VRFRKSIKLAPGVRWNISSSGSSWTLGPRGATVGIGKRGAFLNAGIAGTGLSSRSQLSAPARPVANANSTATVSMTCSIDNEGVLSFLDKAGNPMSEAVVELAKKQNKAAILGLIERKCTEINDQMEALGRLHLDTPDPAFKPAAAAGEFDEPAPAPFVPSRSGLLARLVPGRVRRIEEANAVAQRDHQHAVQRWQECKAQFELARREHNDLVLRQIYSELPAMERYFEQRLLAIVWPRETLVSLQIDDHATLRLDVDLPEIEDMPSKLASVPSRGLKLSLKDMGVTKVQRLYANHVHGILFRLVGEAFAALPTVQTVLAAGYSQRRDPGTGQMNDDYLLSVTVGRAQWSAIDFMALDSVDVSEALARFDLRRDQLKSGALRAIKPH